MNAKTLYYEIKQKKMTTFNFTWALGKALAILHVQQRNRNGLNESVQSKLNRVLGIVNVPAPRIVHENKPGKCTVCV